MKIGIKVCKCLSKNNNKKKIKFYLFVFPPVSNYLSVCLYNGNRNITQRNMQYCQFYFLYTLIIRYKSYMVIQLCKYICNTQSDV